MGQQEVCRACNLDSHQASGFSSHRLDDKYRREQLRARIAASEKWVQREITRVVYMQNSLHFSN